MNENIYNIFDTKSCEKNYSLSNGHAVLAAGSLKLSNGKIIAVDTFSGHYKPTDVQLATFLEFLKMRNVDLNQIKVTYVGDYTVQPWKIYDINVGNVSKWLESVPVTT